ncbi:MAG: L-threonylcarbamoyladenylate synthase [Gammaproteobacteria bacterium]
MTPDPSASIDDAVARLRAGQLVAFPTETVYGLGADAGNAAAVARIFTAKGRPADHPVIVHVLSAEDIDVFACAVPTAARRLAAALWPGPLTLVLPRADGVDDIVTGGQDTIGLRCPAHPVARALLEACRRAGIRGLAAPSANRFGRISPTTAAHVQAEFGPGVMVLDGGPCEIGIESTIVGFVGERPRILRPGMIDARTVADVARESLVERSTPAPRVSGALAQHYAPTTALELLERESLITRTAELASRGKPAAVFAAAATLERLARGVTTLTRLAPETPAAYAQVLYAALHALDASGASVILVERPPAQAGWEAIHDRLGRAAAGAGDGSRTASAATS